MDMRWNIRIRRSLSDLRWWLFGGETSEYRCLTCGLPLPESKSEGTSGAADVVIDEDGQVDYNIPAFLRKANRRPDEPWPNFPQRENAVLADSDRDLFICVPMGDGTSRVTIISDGTRSPGAPVW